MACQDTGQILKHIVRIVIAILLIHECVVETFDFPETSKDLEFSYIDGQLNHRSPRNIGLTAEQLELVVEVNAPEAVVIEQIRALLASIMFPLQLDNSTEITAVNITTVCQPNVTKYQCVCEDGYAWSYNNCQTYEACDDISFGSCGCISGIPSDGEMCVLESALPSNYVIDIDVRFFDWFLVNDLQNLFTNISLPLTLSNNINITDIDVTTVCVLNGTEYECKCEENHVWSSDTCRAYQVCDGIVGGTCGCIQALPSEGPLCQRGRYSCIIERDTIPYIQWQTIVVEERPNIVLGKNELKFQCVDKLVLLTCCEEKYDVEWIPVPSGDEVTPQVDGCITLRHKIMKRNCENETFTCRLKDPVLKDFGYGLNRVTVQKLKEEFSCKNDTLGDGNENQFVTGPCEKNWDGSITYQCTSGNWMEFRRDCILQVINDLQRNVEFLIVERIPAFVSNLSNVTVQNNQIITQSPLTVQTIVEILVNIASILQNIIIDKAVMVNFLKTVDVLVSDKAAASWQSLTKENTSISLLSAIENVTDRLSDVDFTFTETFIELNRTVIKNSYRGKSNLPNSTTEILIPQVLKTTSLTVLVFAKLGKVLPSRNTGNLVSHINGNVVIVKVNETLNNISFTFDITDQSLVNPQCVFWNFNLNAWDSTGCEAKPSGNETGKITCECNHTTTFSILMFNPNDHIALDYITYIGVSISMASLILCLIIESIMWKSINDTSNYTSYMRHVSIVNIVVSLLIANICFIIGVAIAEPEQPTSVGRCSPVVFFMHFFYLALFFWMLISALLLFYRTVMVSHGHGQSWSQMLKAKMMVIAFIVGYGAPLLIAVITVASTAGQENYISKRNSCWLNWYESKALLAFVIPALTILAINLVVLIVVLYKMLGRGVASIQRDEKHALVVIAICVAILTPFFGLTWGFGIGTMVSQDFGMHVVFALLNSLQGFFILVFGTLLDNKILEAVAGGLSLRNHTNFNHSNRTRITSEIPSSSSGDSMALRRRNVNDSRGSRSSIASSSSSNSESSTFMNA